jgi:hypothetical protein
MTIAAASPSQKYSTYVSSGATVDAVFPNNVTAGSLLTIVVCAIEATGGHTPVAGDLTKQSGTATIGTVTLDKLQSWLFSGLYPKYAAVYSCIVTGSGSLTMRYANAASGSSLFIGADEYTGNWNSSRVEATNGASPGSLTTAPDSGNATSAGAALFVGGLTFFTASTSAVVTEDGAFTLIGEQNSVTSTQMGASVISRIVSSGTTDSASWALDVSQYPASAVVAYKEAAGGGSNTTITPGAGSVTLGSKPPERYVTQASRPFYVGGTTGELDSSTNTSYTVSLTSLTGGIDTQPRTGDIVIVGTGWTATTNGSPGISSPTGFTEVGFTGGGYADDTRDSNLYVGWKLMGASPDTSLTVGAGGSASYGNATVVHVWRGVDALSPMDVTVPAGATGTNASRPNPPSITPTTAGAVVVTVGGATGATAQTAMTAPSGYQNTRTAVGDGSTGDFEAVIASWNLWTSGAHDAAAWTGGTTSTSDSWTAVSLALRPGKYIEPPPAAQIILLGAGPTVTINLGSQTITPAAGAVTVTGTAPTAFTPITITPSAGVVAVAGTAPGVTISGQTNLITPSAGAVVFTGSLPVQTYTLPAPAAATITLTGYAPTVTVGASFTITPAAGTVTATGAAPALSYSWLITPSAGTVAVTGAAPTATYSWRVTPAAGTVAVTGTAPTATYSWLVTPAAGAATVTGTAPSLAYSWLVTPAAGTVAVTGTAPDLTLTSASAITPPAGTVSVVGIAPTVTRTEHQSIQPAAGVLSVAGTAPQIHRLLTPPAGTLAATGTAPSLAYSWLVRPAAGTVALTGTAPDATVTQSGEISPLYGTVSLAGYAPVVGGSYTIRPAAATVVLTGAAPTAGATLSAQPPAGALSVEGAAPTVTNTAHQTVQPAAGALALAGTAPVIDWLLRPASGALVASGAAPSLSYSWLVTPAAGVVSVAGVVPQVQRTESGVIQPFSGALTLTGATPVVGGSYTIRPDLGGSFQIRPPAGAVSVAGAAPTVTVSLSVQPAAGTVVVAGVAPTVTRTAHHVVQPDAATVLMSAAQPILARTEHHFADPPAGVLALTGRLPGVQLSNALSVEPDAGALALAAIRPVVVVTGYASPGKAGRRGGARPHQAVTDSRLVDAPLDRPRKAVENRPRQIV